MEECFWKEGISFVCLQCSDCCRHEPGNVFLVEEDVPLLLKTLNLSFETFVEKYCRWVYLQDGFEYLSFKEKENYDCIFWENGCTLYNARPLQCKAFPFWPFALESKQNCACITSSCPGCKASNLLSNKHREADVGREKNSNIYFPTSAKGQQTTNDTKDFTTNNDIDIQQSLQYFSYGEIAYIRNMQLNAKQIKRKRGEI